MYESHPSLDPPQTDALLWRYMDLARLLFLLETRTLFFPRLTTFNDPFEGYLTKPTVGVVSAIPEDLPDEERQHRRDVILENLRTLVGFRSLLCVSCWHQNEVESAAMWELYLRSGEGIAIRSSFRRFSGSFQPEEPRVSGGMVKYVDYDTYEIDYRNVYDWVIIKRKSFEHEREFRAVVLDAGPDPGGVAVPVQVERLVEAVFVAPSAASWFTNLVTKVMARYGLDAPVVQSQLHAHPMYALGEPDVA